MHAIILTAGLGRRMRPKTFDNHKTLLQVAGKAILCRIIDALLTNNICQITIGTGYCESRLKRYLKDCYPKIQFNYINNSRFKETNNIYSLSQILNTCEIDDDILLIESDLIFESNVIKKIINSSYENVALVDHYQPGMDGTVVEIADNKIINIFLPHLQLKNFSYVNKYKTLNIYKFSKSFCKNVFKKILAFYVNSIDDNCYYEYILGVLIYVQKETIFAELIHDEKWTEVDDANDLEIAEYIFNPSKRFDLINHKFGGLWNFDIIDFCFPVNQYFPGESVMSEFKNCFEKMIKSYSSCQLELNKKLSYFLLCDEKYVTMLNGASQIYPLLSNIWSKKKVLMPSLTFGEYHRVFINTSYYEDKGRVCENEIVKKTKSSDIIVFVNPNNPTGTILSTQFIYKLAQSNPQKNFVVDESFLDFSEEISIMKFLNNEPLDNIIVIKSLSKNLGVPGLRLGFVFSTNQDFQTFVNQNIPIWNINSIAEHLLEILLKNRDYLVLSYELTKKDREKFIDNLSKLDFISHVFPSHANYILIKFKDVYSKLSGLSKALLEKDHIYVKDVSEKIKDEFTYFRIAVRKHDENCFFIQSLKRNYENI